MKYSFDYSFTVKYKSFQSRWVVLTTKFVHYSLRKWLHAEKYEITFSLHGTRVGLSLDFHHGHKNYDICS